MLNGPWGNLTRRVVRRSLMISADWLCGFSLSATRSPLQPPARQSRPFRGFSISVEKAEPISIVCNSWRGNRQLESFKGITTRVWDKDVWRETLPFFLVCLKRSKNASEKALTIAITRQTVRVNLFNQSQKSQTASNSFDSAVEFPAFVFSQVVRARNDA